jgi:hypothetical protein
MRRCLATPLLIFVACGGSPAAPTPAPTGTPAPTVTYTIHSAETGEPTSATVTVNGSREGTLTGPQLTFTSVRLNAEASATVPSGFVSPRQGVIKGFGQSDIYLWPDNQRVPARLTQELLYTDDGQGDYPLARITDQVAYVVLDPSLQSDENRAALQTFANMISGANGWTNLVETTAPPSSAVVINIQLDPSGIGVFPVGPGQGVALTAPLAGRP